MSYKRKFPILFVFFWIAIAGLFAQEQKIALFISWAGTDKIIITSTENEPGGPVKISELEKKAKSIGPSRQKSCPTSNDCLRDKMYRHQGVAGAALNWLLKKLQLP